MTDIKQLIKRWESQDRGPLAPKTYDVRLSLHDAARISALHEMYPQRSVEEIITDLLAAALDELESSLPYVEGSTVVARDEEGDPIYEDVGPSRRLHDLTRKYMRDLQSAGSAERNH